MRKWIVSWLTISAVAACADSPTTAPIPVGQFANRTWNESENFESEEEALAAAQAANALPDAIASAGWTDWSGGSAKSYGYFQYINANYVTGDARITTKYGSTTERDSDWQRASDSRVVTGGQYLDPWPHFRKDVSVPITKPCGLQSQVQAKMDAKFFALVKWAPAVIAHKEDDDAQWSDQGGCAVVEYGGGGPSGGSGCGMFILQVQDYAGSWYNVGEPFEVCGDWQEWQTAKRSRGPLSSDMAAARNTGELTAMALRAGRVDPAKRITVRFRAAAPLEQRAVGFVEADKGGAVALVTMDTSRTTPEDVEATLLAVRRFVDINRSDVRIPIYKNDLGPAARERANGNSRSLLQSLRSPKASHALGGIRGEVLTEVELPSIVVKLKH